MLFSICPGLHSPFNFPTGLQLLFTQIAVQLISSHAVKILWVTKLKYIWFIDRRLLDTFANIQGAIISKGKYFSDKKSFPLSFWVVWAVGHNRVWLGRQCWWLLSWGYCHLSEGRSALGPCVLSVRFRSSYRRNVNCSNRVFLRWLIAKFHVWVSVMGPVPGPILTGHLRWLSRGWCEHELARHWLIRTDKLHYWPMRWLARDHKSHFAHTLAAVISHLQWPHATLQCQRGQCWYLQQSVDWGLQFCKQSRVLHEVCIPGLVLRGTGRYSGGVWTGTDWEYGRHVSRVTHWAGHVTTKCVHVSPYIACGNCGV